MKETVKERAILQEKITEGRINGKNAMTVSDINELKGHRGSAIHGIFITAGRAETAVTTERNKLEISAVDTAIHGTTERWKLCLFLKQSLRGTHRFCSQYKA